ncbi:MULTISPECIES: S-4TM family putative pore-forming effector [unclassified Shewanella]|uniref:S-4TM family putative pore-forming effector n=1 Tax=unclassified Shewanella TaxID=196818 RepID=UPI0021DA5811|nr:MULTISPECIES: S-4TM family putative pore-forming effector [unclassified Shewanella]MCU8024421.1 S-4TM family putative pore-forming effector [Shewanella sp. SM78]MCU8081318.1 S-4TM family putative pore-forming effector [Shewanella sp. SM103]
MTCIVSNQKQAAAVEAGTAFRYAYGRSKFWKAWIWGTALLLAFVQTAISVYIFAGNKTPFDPAYLAIGPLLAFIFIGTFGKYLINKWQSLGCILQRLHDHQTMGIGVKPSHLELPRSLVGELSIKQLKEVPGDREQLETWWSSRLTDVPHPVAKIIATFSTFAWESELRKRYQDVLLILLVACIVIPILVSLVLNYTILQSLAFVIGPFTPIIAVVLDEWLMNRQNLKIAEQLTQGCYNSWDNILTGKLNNDEMHSATEQHMRYWQNFRQSATPIFEWLYRLSRTQMESNMLVNTDQLITDFNKN